MPKTQIAAALCVAAFAAPAMGQNVPCDGTYQVQMGPVIMSGGIVGRPAEDMGVAQVDVHSCGRGFTFDLGGTLDFAQDVFDDQTYSGGFTGGDGATRSYTLTLAGPRRMIGGLVAQDSDMQVTRSIVLTAIDVRPPDLSDCQGDAPSEGLPDRGTTLSEAAMQSALSARGLAPPAGSGLGLGDYTSGRGHSDATEMRVSILLSADGRLLPRLPDDAIADTTAGICAPPPAEFERARFMLEAKMFRFDSGTNVFLRIIDIETGQIIEQREAVVSGEDATAMGVGIGQAWNALNWSTSGMSSGRIGG